MLRQKRRQVEFLFHHLILEALSVSLHRKVHGEQEVVEEVLVEEERPYLASHHPFLHQIGIRNGKTR